MKRIKKNLPAVFLGSLILIAVVIYHQFLLNKQADTFFNHNRFDYGSFENNLDDKSDLLCELYAFNIISGYPEMHASLGEENDPRRTIRVSFDDSVIEVDNDEYFAGFIRDDFQWKLVENSDKRVVANVNDNYINAFLYLTKKDGKMIMSVLESTPHHGSDGKENSDLANIYFVCE